MKNVSADNPHAGQPVLFKGEKFENASFAMILVHGRGADAKSILSLSDEFENKDKFIFAAPQAANNTWYPYSFLSPREMNEPGLTSGLNIINELINDFASKGISSERTIILGFSQGACLSLEYSARNIQKYGGIIALSGGLIGNKLDPSSYKGNFDNSPVFLGCSDIDPHIPLDRVNESATILSEKGANVIKKIYRGMGHTINSDELQFINNIIADIRNT